MRSPPHVVRAGIEPAVVYPNGNKVFYLAQGTETQGTFGLYRWEFAGPPSGPDAHFHRTITESFYVLEGIVTIYDGTDWVKCAAGDFAHVPAGGIHGFRNEDGPAQDAAPLRAGRPARGVLRGSAAGMGDLDADAYDRFMREHDNTWL